MADSRNPHAIETIYSAIIDLGDWESVRYLFWCPCGIHGYKTLPIPKFLAKEALTGVLNSRDGLYLDIAIINEKEVESFIFFNGKLSCGYRGNYYDDDTVVQFDYESSAEDNLRIRIR